MRITYLDKKTIETKFGAKEKYTLKLQKDDGAEVFCDSWVSKWNQYWKVGDEIYPVKEQWKSREYNGKTYWTLEQLKIDWGNELVKVNEKLDRVLFILGADKKDEHIKQAVDMLGGRVVAEPEIPTINMDEPSIDDREYKLADVPF